MICAKGKQRMHHRKLHHRNMETRDFTK